MSSMFAQTEIFESTPYDTADNRAIEEQVGAAQVQLNQAQKIQNSQNYDNSIIQNNNEYTSSQQNMKQQFVMIDQQQLLELMQAKQILDAQRQAAVEAPVHAVVTNQRQNSANQALFSTPQKPENVFTGSQNPVQTHQSTKDTQEEATTISSLKVKETESQEQSLFKAPFMFDLEDEFPGEDPDKNCGFIDSTTQRNHIKNSLLNMIDDEPAETSAFDVANAKPDCFPQKEAGEPASKQLIDHLVTAIQSIDLQSQTKLNHKPQVGMPAEKDFYDLDESIFKGSAASTLNLTNEGSQFTNNSIFSSHSSDPFYRGPTAASTINNIVINNFNAQPEYNPHASSAPQSNAVTYQSQLQQAAPQPFFPPLGSVIKQGPTIEQAAELAQVTQMAGGVKPLHHSNKPARQAQAPVQKQQFAPAFVPASEPKTENAASSPAVVADQKKEKNEKKQKQFDFPEGGWECSKCQNYNFKGRKECYRCKKIKSDEDQDGKPTHMFLPADEKAALKAAKSKKPKSKAKKEKVEPSDQDKNDQKDTTSAQLNALNQINSFATSNPFGGQNSQGEAKPKAYQSRQGQGQNAGKKHSNQERVGDWTCQRCFNHNYAFRDVCNMCYLSHIESNKMLYNQQQNRLETVVQNGMYNQPQPSYYPQNQYVPMGYENNNMGSMTVEEIQPPKLSLLSQSAKPFIPTYLSKQNKQFGNNSHEQDLQHQIYQ